MKKGHPYLAIIGSFISIILIGTLLLLLPISAKDRHTIGFPNSLFMSTSCVCVTGLSVLPNSVAADLSIFGKFVMYLLMEVGGLSIITIAVFFFTILGAKLGITNKLILKEQLNQNSQIGLLKLVKRIIIISFSIQLIGTLINWYPVYDLLKNTNGGGVVKAFFISTFHSCAAFNNAGFDVFGSNSMEAFASNAHVVSTLSVYIINISTMVMILLGGIGFVILTDVIDNRFVWRKFRLHTKITLVTTLCLFLFGGLFLKFSSDMKLLEAFFTAVTCRTAGFATYNMAGLHNHPVAYLITILLMFIGASPCSCGGGIKTTTVAIIAVAVWYYAIGRRVKLFKRNISYRDVFKAFVLLNMGIVLVFVTTVLFLASQPNIGLEMGLFEVISAFSTTGLSMGVTSSLSVFNKIMLSVVMLFGRLGPLTVIGVLNKHWMDEAPEAIKYPEEGVIIG